MFTGIKIHLAHTLTELERQFQDNERKDFVCIEPYRKYCKEETLKLIEIYKARGYRYFPVCNNIDQLGKCLTHKTYTYGSVKTRIGGARMSELNIDAEFKRMEEDDGDLRPKEPMKFAEGDKVEFVITKGNLKGTYKGEVIGLKPEKNRVQVQYEDGEISWEDQDNEGLRKVE